MSQQSLQMQSQYLCHHIKDLVEMIYMDQTGHFPAVSHQGHKYIMCLVKGDGNYIALEPMISHDKVEMIWFYNQLIDQLQK